MKKKLLVFLSFGLIILTGCFGGKATVFEDVYEQVNDIDRIPGTNFEIMTGIGDGKTKYWEARSEDDGTIVLYADDSGKVVYTYDAGDINRERRGIINYKQVGINNKQELFVRYEIGAEPKVCSLKKDDCDSEMHSQLGALISGFKRINIDVEDKKYGYIK